MVFDVERYSLSDKVVLITGAGRGLGEATANALAGRGAQVVLADVNLLFPQCSRSRGRCRTVVVLALECDVTQLDSVQEARTAAREEFGRIWTS